MAWQQKAPQHGVSFEIRVMKITFGQALDGTELWAADNSIGDVVCGPLRLTEIFETQLGLKRKSVSEMTRVFQFVKVLEKLAENKPRFYSTSFEKDPLAVSEALLHWRDSLAFVGWIDEAFSKMDNRPRL